MPDSDVNREISADQMVAANLGRARRLKNLTQEQAAELIERYLGPPRWSRASFSQAERGIDGPPVRHFDANEIVAFCMAFDLPVSFFFTPPDGTTFLYASEQRPSEAAWGHGPPIDAVDAPFIPADAPLIPKPLRPWQVEEIAGLGSSDDGAGDAAELEQIAKRIRRRARR